MVILDSTDSENPVESEEKSVEASGLKSIRICWTSLQSGLWGPYNLPFIGDVKKKLTHSEAFEIWLHRVKGH